MRVDVPEKPWRQKRWAAWRRAISRSNDRGRPRNAVAMLAILAQSLHNLFMDQLIQKRIEVRDSWVTLDVYGDPSGPAIVVIPGAMANAAAWGEFAQRLEGWP